MNYFSGCKRVRESRDGILMHDADVIPKLTQVSNEKVPVNCVGYLSMTEMFQVSSIGPPILNVSVNISFMHCDLVLTSEYPVMHQ